MASSKVLDSADIAAAGGALTGHTHVISDVTGLQTALDGKQAAGSYATAADIAGKLDTSAYTAADVLTKIKTVDGSGSGLDADTVDGQDGSYYLAWSNLTGVPSTFTPATHSHAISDVTGLSSSLAAKLDSSAYTASDVLAKVVTVDGAASGLDADLLDGQHGSYYLAWNNLTGVPSTFTPATHSHAISDVTGLQTALDGKQTAGSYATSAELAAKLDTASYTAADVLAKIVTVDGATSGLDSDLLDGQHGSYYQNANNLNSGTVAAARLPAFTGDATSTAGTSALTLATVNSNTGSFGSATAIPILTVNAKGLVTAAFTTTVTPAWSSITSKPTTLDGYGITDAVKTVNGVSPDASGNVSVSGGGGSSDTAAEILAKLVTVDGSASGLDADLLDGQHGSYYLAWNNLTGVPSTFTPAAHSHAISDVTGLQTQLDLRIKTVNGVAPDEYGNVIVSGGGGSSDTAAEILVKIKTVDGVDSGLDADLLDGQHGNYYLAWNNLTGVPSTFTPATHTHTIADITGLQTTLDSKLASASYTAADVLSKLLTVDGANSGLDADLLDGQEGSYYLAWNNLTGVPTSFTPATHSHVIADVTGLQTALDSKLASASYTAADVLTKIKTVDGTGSGLDADLLDGQGGTYYQDASNLNAGTVAAARLPAFTGDITSTVGTSTLTLATVNSNTGSFGSGTSIPVVTVNAKGLVTAASSVSVTPTWSSITSKPTTIAGYGITDLGTAATLNHGTSAGNLVRLDPSTGKLPAVDGSALTGLATGGGLSNSVAITSTTSFTWEAGKTYLIWAKGGGGGGGEGSRLSADSCHLAGGSGAEWFGTYTPSAGGAYTQTIGGGGNKGQDASTGGTTTIATPDGYIEIYGGRGGVYRSYDTSPTGPPDYAATPGGNPPNASISPSWRAVGIGRRGESGLPGMYMNTSSGTRLLPTGGGGLGAGVTGWAGPQDNRGSGGIAGPPGYATNGAAGFIFIAW